MRSRRIKLGSWLLTVVALGGGAVTAAVLAVDPGTPENGPELMRRVADTSRRLRTLHARSELVRTVPRSAPSHHVIEIWIDVERHRIRCELRTPDRPAPSSVHVVDDQVFWTHQRDLREYARGQSPAGFDARLAQAMAGELWLTAFQGALGSLRTMSYREATIAGEETLEELSCWKLTFAGNRTTELWICKQDLLPRRIVGYTREARHEERLLFLETDVELSESLFEVEPGVSAVVLETLAARERWSKAGTQSTRWPAAKSIAPELMATGLDGKPRTLESMRGRSFLLAFWFSSHEPCIESIELAQEELARMARDEPAPSLVAVHYGSDGGSLARLVEQRKLHFDCWLAGDPASSDNAFETYRIASCPVFFAVDENLVIQGATREPSEIQKLFQDG